MGSLTSVDYEVKSITDDLEPSPSAPAEAGTPEPYMDNEPELVLDTTSQTRPNLLIDPEEAPEGGGTDDTTYKRKVIKKTKKKTKTKASAVSGE